MSGDYTRVSFNPHDDYSGVLLQQGRVTLDADVNEQIDIVDRRIRADVVDTLARGAISRETPGAFLLAPGGGDLTIAPGRALVHGLLAENHGLPPNEYDSVLGEQRGTQPVSYLAQPYLPDAATLAPLPASGTHLAYLDVWQREVSCLQDTAIVEPAVAVDTAMRRQTAWQVRLVAAVTGDTCASPNPAYDAATAPSGGRLSTAAVGFPVSTDPCTIAPFGGFRGLENRLYRVEIHDPGPLGAATFKWSRDNASLGASVLGIDAGRTTLKLSRLGRDGVRRIGVGDWVEVTDDQHELHRLPGELRQVGGVDEVRAELTFAPALSAGAFDAADAARHTRVIRWDQTGAAVDAAGGVVAVPAGGAGAPVALEDGIVVMFDVASVAGFLTGDHWEFAARTADATVDELVAEPPRGVLRHHMKLGVVTFPGTFTDCRPTTPGAEACGCECDVCVTPERHASGELTIQQAVNQVRDTGGKVCLQAGVYRLDKPVFVDRASSVQIEGKGWRTIILAAVAGPAFVVERSIGVTIDLLTMVAPTAARRGQVALGTAIALRSTIGTIIERCVLLQLGVLERDPPPRGGPDDPQEPEDPCPPEELRPFAGRLRRLPDLRAPFGPKGTGGPLIALDGLVLETLIRENVLVGATGIGALGTDLGEPVSSEPVAGTPPSVPGSVTHVPPWAPANAASRERSSYLLTSDIAIEENLLVCWLTGVSLEGFVLHQGDTRIRGNAALVCLRAGVAATGIVGAGGRVDIVGNLIRGLGMGVAFATDDTRVADNDVRLLAGAAGTRKEGSTVALGTALSRASGLLAESVERVAAYLSLFGGDGIILVSGVRPAPIDRAQVRGNRVTDVLGDAIALRARVSSAQIAGNTVQRVGGSGIAMTSEAAAEELLVEGNQFVDVGRRQAESGPVPAAVRLTNTHDAVVTGNQIRGVGAGAAKGPARAGVLAFGTVMLRVSSNTILDVGTGAFAGHAVGVAVLGAFERVDVLDNTIRRGGTGVDASPRVAIEINDFAAGPAGVPIDRSLILGLTRLIGRQRAFTFQEHAGKIVILGRDPGSAGVRGNVADGSGRENAAILVSVRGGCVIAENRVTLDSVAEDATGIRVTAGSAAVSANHVLGDRARRSIDLQLAPHGSPYTMLGNVTSGPILVDGAALPAPWKALNV